MLSSLLVFVCCFCYDRMKNKTGDRNGMKDRMKIGSHVGMSGKEMFLGSVKEALSYGSNTFMIYTGAPQNTRRKSIEELNIEAGWNLMREHGIEEFIVDENNESYYTIDGVLINKSMNYISCYPPGKTDVSFTIPETVTTISNITNPHLKELIMHENMFDISWYPLKDSAIDTIFYKGSQDSFNNVLNTYESPDGVLENAKVYYDYNNTPISAHLTCNYENSQFKGEISYKYMLTDCVAYIAVYNSENKLLKFTKVGEISKNQTAKTSISFPCPDPGSEGYAKILFLTDLSTLSPAGMWTAMDVFPL